MDGDDGVIYTNELLTFDGDGVQLTIAHPIGNAIAPVTLTTHDMAKGRVMSSRIRSCR